MRSDLAALWTSFADSSCRSYSPLYDRVCRAVAASEEVLGLIDEAPPTGHLPNVLLAGVHYLLLSGIEHPLGAVYAGVSDRDPGPLFVDFCLAHRARLIELMSTRHTNTNEVGRSAAIGPALTVVAKRLGEPLGLVDVGCSAGLNLLCDRYRLDYGAAGCTGPHDARVHITCDVAAGSPPIAPLLPEVVARVGVDRHVVDAGNDDETRWLLACVWPDTGRLPRTRLALEEVRRTPPQFVQGDAVDSIGDVLASIPDGAVPVVITTWAQAYLSPEQRQAFHDALAAASDRRPVAWISGEGAGVVGAFSDVTAPAGPDGTDPSLLGLVTFSGGDASPELLAFVHPHGQWLDWQA